MERHLFNTPPLREKRTAHFHPNRLSEKRLGYFRKELEFSIGKEDSQINALCIEMIRDLNTLNYLKE